jgi:hypothetical protein
MTKFLLGVAVGYMLSDIIDDFLGKSAPEKPSPPSTSPSAPEDLTREMPTTPPPSPPMS